MTATAPKIRITPALLAGCALRRGPGYVSNTHWLVRSKRVAAPLPETPKPVRDRLARIVLGTDGRQHRVTRTGRRKPLVCGSRSYTAVEFASRSGKVRVWIQRAYADGFGLTTLWVADENQPYTDARGDDWTVAVMGMRV